MSTIDDIIYLKDSIIDDQQKKIDLLMRALENAVEWNWTSDEGIPDSVRDLICEATEDY